MILIATQSFAEVPQIACPGEGEVAALCQRCNGGDGKACAELGELYRHGTQGLGRDRNRAVRAFLVGCQNGDAVSCTTLGYMTSGERRREYLEMGCDRGNGRACRLIGHALELHDRRAAREYFERGCELGNAAACFAFGRQFLRGTRSERDVRRAAQYFRLACELGSTEGCTRLDPELPSASRRLFPFFSIGVVQDRSSSENPSARFTSDVGFGYRQRLYRFLSSPAAFQLVPMVGYSYSHGLLTGEHWALLGLGLRFIGNEVRDNCGVTLQVAYIVNSFEHQAMGLRTGVRVGIFYDTVFIGLHHEWHRALGEDRHLIRVMFSANLGALLYTIVQRI